MNNKIAILEDETDIQELLSVNLTKESYSVELFDSAVKLKQYLNHNHVDLLILDLMLPDADGLDLCKEFKASEETKHIPIILLTAKSHEFDKVLGLELGADDYITKPFSVRELIARIKVILKRYKKNTETHETNKDVIRIGTNVLIDPQRYEVKYDTKLIQLTKTEFKILMVLGEKKGRVFSRDQLLEYLWGNDKIVTDRTIDVHIKNLRDKLGDAGRFIKNIKGIGYKVEE